MTLQLSPAESVDVFDALKYRIRQLDKDAVKYDDANARRKADRLRGVQEQMSHAVSKNDVPARQEVL